MTGERVVRRLAAILAADVVGYSRLMGRDENGTLARLKAHRTERLEPLLARHGGRLVKLTGDGALIEFPSAVNALSAAIEFQEAMAEANRDQPEDARIVFRVGLHLGDLIVDGDDLYGDGVNVAARLETEAPPGGIVISGDVYNAVTGRLKAAFSDLGELSLKNIERPVRAFRVQMDGVPAMAPPPHATDVPLPLPDKPSIAVLPFQNMSGDPEQDYFADGMVEDIITALSRFKSLFVIARNSSFTYKGRPVDIKLVGRELGVRYVLEGSVRKSGNRVRITGQLIQADSGAHMWAERYDGDLSDIFELQDRVATDVVRAIAPRLELAEIERARLKPTESLDAYDSWFRGLASLYLSTVAGFEQALQLFLRARTLDPAFAAPHAMATYCYMALRGQGVTLNTDQVAEATHLARRALELGPDDAIALSVAGQAVAFIGRDLDTAAAAIARALQLNPNLAFAWSASGWVEVWLGHPEVAIEQFSHAMRLNPLDLNLNWMLRGLAHAYVMDGQDIKALECARAAIGRGDGVLGPGLRIAAVSAAFVGNHEEARGYRERLQELDPDRRVGNVEATMGPYRRPRDIERMKQGLRLAGLPE